LISTFVWIEKALVRGDYDKDWLEVKGRFKSKFLKYHRLEDYTVNLDSFYKTQLEYIGDAYRIKYENDELSIFEKSNGNYQLPQIMYVPAERNFIAYVKNPKELKLSSDSMIEFLTEFDNAKREINENIVLPINNVDIEYDRLKDVLKGAVAICPKNIRF